MRTASNACSRAQSAAHTAACHHRITHTLVVLLHVHPQYSWLWFSIINIILIVCHHSPHKSATCYQSQEKPPSSNKARPIRCFRELLTFIMESSRVELYDCAVLSTNSRQETFEVKMFVKKTVRHSKIISVYVLFVHITIPLASQSGKQSATKPPPTTKLIHYIQPVIIK